VGDTFTLIAYKPSSDCRHGGCHMASYDSNFHLTRDLTLEQIRERIAQLESEELDCCEDGYESISYISNEGVHHFYKAGGLPLEYDDYFIQRFHESILARTEQIRQEREAERNKKKQAEELIQKQKKEEYEREQLRILQAKYG
jgi:hypothetical protein